MKKLLLLALFSVFFLNYIKAQTIRDSLMSNGLMRYYYIYLSKNYQPGMPLIIVLHGYADGAASILAISNFFAIADTGNFLVVCPEGYHDAQLNQCWNVGWVLGATANDLLFISDLVDSLHSRNNIDLSRVYACGLSNGAVMSYELATSLSNKITAIASVSGTMPPTVFDTTVAKRAVPIIEIHGTNDVTFPWAGGTSGKFTSVSVDTLRKSWINADQCKTEDSIAIPDVNTTDGSTVEQYIFSGGTNGALVELYKVIGAGHGDWPGSSIGTNNDFNASLVMWNFFKQYTLGQFTGVKQINAGAPIHFYPDPATNLVQCTLSQEWRNTSFQVQLINAMGQLLKNYAIYPTSTLQLDLSDLPAGYYTVKLNNGKISITGKLIKD